MAFFIRVLIFLLLVAGAEAAQPPAGQAMIAPGPITAVWANDGGDKVTQDELRAMTGARPIANRIWTGSGIRLFGGRNEVVAANLVLEAAHERAEGVSVRFDRLTGPEGFVIKSDPIASKSGLFNWVGREIELFYIRYLEIEGLSRMAYETYDERHVPERLRLTGDQSAIAGKGWMDRPDRDKMYPDIAVPLELTPEFVIKAGQNQSIFIDIYIPKTAPAGVYSGSIMIREKGTLRYQVPMSLIVRDFTLPDEPAAKTMIATTYDQVTQRYTGIAYPKPGSDEDRMAAQVRNRQFLLAHRHKLSLIDDNGGAKPWPQTAPRPEWLARLSGALFTAANGYDGPGVGVGNNVFSIGTYGIRRKWPGVPSRQTLQAQADGWEQWFRDNDPQTERFLYLIDESKDYAQTEEWARWMADSQGAGRGLASFATVDLLEALKHIPSLTIIASWLGVGDAVQWQKAADEVRADRRKRLFLYNGMRPASGSFTIEDDGVALRELPWGQYKKRIDRWFYWEATYYDDFQGRRGPTNVFSKAQTFGSATKYDDKLGMTGWNTMNGDGVLFYPGTDKAYPAESYGVEGPIASLRLKQWRRGVQDVDYLKLAEAKDPKRVNAIIERMVPKVLWENGVGDPNNPTWVRAPISWSTNPDDWEAARAELADIIEERSGSSNRH